jgi:hypothetical protein
MNDTDEDIYIRLEEAAALAEHDYSNGWDFIEDKLSSSSMSVPLETQLETIIVISEINNQKSEDLISRVLFDNSRNEEIRAGAAWALGQFNSNTSANALVNVFNSTSQQVKIEAAHALLQIAENQIPELLRLFSEAENSKKDGISWSFQE